MTKKAREVRFIGMELVRFPNLLLLVGDKTGMGCNYRDPDKAPYFLMIRNTVVK